MARFGAVVSRLEACPDTPIPQPPHMGQEFTVRESIAIGLVR